MSAPLWVFILVMFIAFAIRRLILYLHIFQQEEYNVSRFVKWIVKTRTYDRRLTFGIMMLVILAHFLPRLGGWVAVAIVGGLFLTSAWRERNPLKDAKKKLVLTARAKRVLAIASIYSAGLGFTFSYLYLQPIYWLIPIQLLPLMLIFSVWTLAPHEAVVQKGYWIEANEKLLRLEPQVIGITGSFGKTSTKNILAHVLETTSIGLATPGSVNTPMGIVRIIRERLRPEHKYFIAEMGAYGPGSIKRLCQLAPPNLSIITAVGKAHYERFQSLETVASTKFELAEATIARGGKVIVTEEIMSYEPAKIFAGRFPEAMIVCGKSENCDLRIISNLQKKNGLSLTFEWCNLRYDINAPIFGEHQVSNVSLVFAAACTLGIDPETVRLTLNTVPQITHRVEVRNGPNGATLIDDAYNSNPEGFASALKILDILVKPGGRRILVTPGMVELGTSHDDEHRRLGELAATHADLLLAILPERIQSFVTAFESKIEDKTKIIGCATFKEANDWISQHVQPEDIVLLENDLPDLYEVRLNI